MQYTQMVSNKKVTFLGNPLQLVSVSIFMSLNPEVLNGLVLHSMVILDLLEKGEIMFS